MAKKKSKAKRPLAGLLPYKLQQIILVVLLVGLVISSIVYVWQIHTDQRNGDIGGRETSFQENDGTATPNDTSAATQGEQ